MILNFDESGNMGKAGRHFTIACIGGENMKPLENVMNRAIKKTKSEFTRFSDAREIKANESNPSIKDFFLRKIVSKDVDIRYVVADLDNVKQALRDDENLLYNYMLHFIIMPVARRRDVNKLTLNLDKRTIKVKSTNSFADYIKIKLNYEYNCNVEITVNYYESHNSLAIQAADFLANAINSYYEYGHSYYYDLIRHKITQKEEFPRSHFGRQKVLHYSK